MAKPVPIYDVNNPHFLREDIELALNEIFGLYNVKFFKKKNTKFRSRTIVPIQHHWASNECKQAFNQLIPKIKSLTKDMYAIIEGVHKSIHGNFNAKDLEGRYDDFRLLRLFNNKLKHHDNRQINFVLTERVTQDDTDNLIDCLIQYKFSDSEKWAVLNFTELIEVFLSLLEQERVISVDRH